MTAKPLTARFGFFPPASRYFGGGGKTVAPQVVIPSAPATPAPAPAIAAAVAPPPSAPATATSTEVVQAQRDVQRQALKRRGFGRDTIKAGDSGGWMGHAPTPPATKLGN